MNKLLTLKQMSRKMVRDINRICDEEGVPKKDRAKLAVLALNPYLYYGLKGK